MNEIIKKNGISYGIVTGVVGALITTAIYSIDINLFTAWWITLLNVLFYVTIAVLLLSKTKKELNGIFPFKDAFTTYFLSAVIGILISVGFNIILFNFIDPSAKESIKEVSIKYAVEMMEKFNTPSRWQKRVPPRCCGGSTYRQKLAVIWTLTTRFYMTDNISNF